MNNRRNFLRDALIAISISLLPKILQPSDGTAEEVETGLVYVGEEMGFVQYIETYAGTHYWGMESGGGYIQFSPIHVDVPPEFVVAENMAWYKLYKKLYPECIP